MVGIVAKIMLSDLGLLSLLREALYNLCLEMYFAGNSEFEISEILQVRAN